MDEPRGPVEVPELPAEGPGSLAGLGLRFSARLIDGLVMLLPFAVWTARYTETIRDGGEVILIDHSPAWLLVLGTVVPVLYEVVLIWLTGQTVGKALLKIRVQRQSDLRLPTPAQAFVRYAVHGALGVIAYVVGASADVQVVVGVLSFAVFLPAFRDPLRRGFHDRLAGTIVLRTT